MIVSNLPAIRSVELKLLDYRFKLRGPLDISDSPIVIIAIDDQSDESTESRWPWPREYYAHVIENLNEAGAKVIGVDVLFDQPDQNGPASDERFKEVLEKYNNIVLVGKIVRSSDRLNLISIVTPYYDFTETGVSYGLVSSEADEDAITRRYLLAQEHQDTLYTSFAIEVLKIAQGYDKNTLIEDQPDRFICGDFQIPKYDHYSMLINYAGPAYTFPVYSFDAILDDKDFNLRDGYDIDAFDDPGDPELGIPPGLFHSGILKDKIVLIGATMQELHDDFPTPFLNTIDESGNPIKALMPGVEVHANALQTILSENYLYRLDFWEQLWILIILGISIYLVSYRLPTIWGSIFSFILVLICLTAGIILFARYRLVIELSAPILLIVFSFFGHNLYQYILTQKEKRMIQGAFAHYVPKKVVAEILKNPDQLKLGGEERVVTVLFSDIANFTTISEKMEPAQLVHLLNEYLTEMSEIILANEGIIDKYEGDAIMAEFGVPVPFDGHAILACRTALEMQKRLRRLREKWKTENRPQLSSRIGINTGEVIVGNLGSRDVFDYTVLGDAVNLGSRLEGVNKVYGTQIMISEFTHKEIQNHFVTRMIDLIRVKGKSEAIRVYELITTKDEQPDTDTFEMLKQFEDGIVHYQKRDWDRALQCFENCLTLHAHDNPSQIYVNRCQSFKKEPPDPDWDGVTVLDEK